MGVTAISTNRSTTMPTVVYIGDKLKEIRTRRLLTQIELAEKSGVNPTTIVRVERNQAEPHFRTIRKLAKALDVDPTELLGD
jgi:HTH-type transcriptional regulator, competence development regulator